MIKIINRKKYDTETAEYIGCWTNGYGNTDFYYAEESLYRTPKGEYFLVCEGGAMSMYGATYGRDRCYGVELTPVTENQAIEWCEQKEQTEAIEKYFAENIQDA